MEAAALRIGDFHVNILISLFDSSYILKLRNLYLADYEKKMLKWI